MRKQPTSPQPSPEPRRTQAPWQTREWSAGQPDIPLGPWWPEWEQLTPTARAQLVNGLAAALAEIMAEDAPLGESYPTAFQQVVAHLDQVVHWLTTARAQAERRLLPPLLVTCQACGEDLRPHQLKATPTGKLCIGKDGCYQKWKAKQQAEHRAEREAQRQAEREAKRRAEREQERLEAWGL